MNLTTPRRYAKTDRHPQGIGESKRHCIVEVFDPGNKVGRQCGYLRRVGINCLFCRTHMAVLEKGKSVRIPGGVVRLVDGEMIVEVNE